VGEIRQPDREGIFAAVANERRQIASLIDGLSEAQLETPSLCSGWDVKTVAAHIACSVADGLPARGRPTYKSRVKFTARAPQTFGGSSPRDRGTPGATRNPRRPAPQLAIRDGSRIRQHWTEVCEISAA
jgi:uncharacterized protein (TIGR03083 family)